jgi:tetratricopeptide (TPR) repeat protein
MAAPRKHLLWHCFGVGVTVGQLLLFVPTAGGAPCRTTDTVVRGALLSRYPVQAVSDALISLNNDALAKRLPQRLLLEASVAVHLWSEFMTGVEARLRTCLITDADLQALTNMYSQMNRHAALITQVRLQGIRVGRVDIRELENNVRNLSVSFQEVAAFAGKERLLKTATANPARTLERVLAAGEPNAKGDVTEASPIARGQALDSGSEKIDSGVESAYAAGYRYLGEARFREAAEEFQKALAIRQVPELYVALGTALIDVPDLDGAERIVRSGLEQLDTTTRNPLHRSLLLKTLAGVLRHRGRLTDAESAAREAVELIQANASTDTRNLAASYGSLGYIYRAQGKLAEAVTALERASELSRRVEDDASRAASYALTLSYILREVRDLDRALTYGQQALSLNEKVYGITHFRVGLSCVNVAAILRAKGNPHEAASYISRALVIDIGVYGPLHPVVADRAKQVSDVLRAAGDVSGAIKALDIAVESEERRGGQHERVLAATLASRSKLLRSSGNVLGALRDGARAYAVFKKYPASDNEHLITQARHLGALFRAAGQLDNAVQHLSEAVSMMQAKTATDIHIAPIERDIAVILRAKGDLVDSVAHARKAMELRQREYGSENNNVAEDAELIAKIYVALNRPQDALPFARIAARSLERSYGAAGIRAVQARTLERRIGRAIPAPAK